MHITTRLACLAGLFWLVLPPLAASSAQLANPAGTWQQLDRKTGKVTSIVRIDITHGTLTGTVLKVMNMSPGFMARNGDPPVCTRCRGKRHDQPIAGMAIVWGLRRHGRQWEGGYGLDPSNGKTYKIKLHLTDHGQRLKVRAYIGIPMVGRTLTWHRVAQ